jgi:peptide/nickel transport system ATP-binding protein
MLLSVRDLCVHFHSRDDADTSFPAIDHVDFDLAEGERLGIVGESGCGKSSVALALLRLLDGAGVEMTAERLSLNGHSLIDADEAGLHDIRGAEISMVFQNPSSALHPLIPVGEQVSEVLRYHRSLGRKEAQEKTVELFRKVGIGAPEQRLSAYPFELSGGMCQRVMIAMAIACGPRLLIADEPTTALDVTVQAQIIDLIWDLSETLGMAVILISHDLGVVAGLVDRVAVMYAGAIVEVGPVEDIFASPAHPYTRSLLRSALAEGGLGGELPVIAGSVQGAQWLQGCKFSPRCEFAEPRCAAERQPMRDMGDGHGAACWKAGALPADTKVVDAGAEQGGL